MCFKRFNIGWILLTSLVSVAALGQAVFPTDLKPVRQEMERLDQLSFTAPSFAEDPDPPSSSKPGTPEEYTLVKRFPQNLAGNFKALFSTKNIVPLLVGGAASGVVAPFDDDIRDDVSIGESSDLGKDGALVGSPVVIWSSVTTLFIWGHYSKNDRFHSFSYSLAQAALIDEGFVQGLKYTVRRTRPDKSDDHSFPSGHTAASFMFASVLQRYYGWKAGIPGYAVASFVGYCRLREEKHWASDVTAGATLGYIVGTSVSRRTGISTRLGKISLSPAVDLAHRGVGFQFAINQN